MGDFVKNPIRFEDLIEGGARFEIDVNKVDLETDMFDVNDEDIEEVNEDEIEKSPWLLDFNSLRKQMVPLSNFLYKKITKQGSLAIPKNSRVVVDYNAYFEREEHSYDSTYMRGKPLKIRLGYGEVLEGLEEAVKSMKKGEEAQFVISYNILYGENGCPPRIKPKADALFIIRCKDFTELMPDTIDTTEQTAFTFTYKKAVLFDGEAKAAFRKRNYLLAITKYKKAIDQIQFVNLKDEHEEKLQKDLLKKFFLNLAVTYNLQDQPKKCCIMINNLNELESIQNNPKALYQQGKALHRIGDFEKARKSLRRAVQLKPDDELIAKEIRLLESQIKKFKENERKMCEKAFGVITNTIAKNAANEKEGETDEATTNLFKKRIKEFMDGQVSSILLPGPLDDSIVKCIQNLEKVFDFKLEINDTSNEVYYKLKKI
ncbi:inactive peptidyl-prolyl cis-trans isomerase shutdown [Culicoides brevitarsis]|uniref:inactive peptidyl-prolyl cis-trans isomerase shutdown n=1 Tax=Culicoides brevitarsis TaxID=469753 RepID=UPI00307B5955